MSINYNSENKSVREIIEYELSLNGVSEFFVQNRIKSNESIKKKQLRKKEFEYKKEITDYSGIRIIINTLKDVRKCIEFITNRFQIDYENTNYNPHSFIEDNEFGYQSSHIVIITNGLKTEIQIRTFSQHIWASTSHKLEYKSALKDSIFSRKLFRLSGLLEQVDIIIDDLHETSPKKNQLSIKTLGALDHYSLEYYLSRKERLFTLICIPFERKSVTMFGTVSSKLDFSMKILNDKNSLEANGNESLGLILIICRILEIKTIESLNAFIEENRKDIRKISNSYKSSKFSKIWTNPYSMRLFFFLVVFIPESNIDELPKNKFSPEFINYLKDFVAIYKMNSK